MLIRDGLNQLKIGARQVVPAGAFSAGDLELSVVLETVNFRGRNDSVGVLGDIWKQFLADLRRLERTRQGSARLSSMSSEDLDLRIHSSDRVGHINISGYMGGLVFHDGEPQVARIPIGLTLDPTLLPEILKDFEALEKPTE
jgi:hypothetical protein